MDSRFIRTAMLLGTESLAYLHNCHVVIFGLGGVGSFCTEALARSGIGTFTLVDYDIIDISNINRQIEALESTVGLPKTEVMQERILNINPYAVVHTINAKYTRKTSTQFFLEKYDYLVDAIDFLEGKVDLAVQSHKRNIPLISSMGTGNKLNPLRFTISDIYKTSVCPVARVMRRALKKEQVPSLKVIYSTEEPLKNRMVSEHLTSKIGSISFVPSVVGLLLASEVIKDLLAKSVAENQGKN